MGFIQTYIHRLHADIQTQPDPSIQTQTASKHTYIDCIQIHKHGCIQAYKHRLHPNATLVSDLGKTYDIRHSKSLEHCRVGFGYSSSVITSVRVDAAKIRMVILRNKCVCVCVFMCVCIHTHIYLYIHTCLYIYVYIYIYIYIYIYTLYMKFVGHDMR
jgi:hypothetical protein